MRLVIGLFTLVVLNSCSFVKENDKYGVQFFIKSVYNDSDVVESGSLISEPFQVKKNDFTSVIIIKLIDSSYFKETQTEIKEYLPQGVKQINFNEVYKSFKRLENEKIIILDSKNLIKDGKVNYLGYLKILQVFSNSSKTKAYIYYDISDYSQKAYARCFTEFHLLNRKWKEVNSTILDRN